MLSERVFYSMRAVLASRVEDCDVHGLRGSGRFINVVAVLAVALYMLLAFFRRWRGKMFRRLC